MRVSLINLGDGGRAVYDINSKFVSVPIGEIVSADLDGRTLKNLLKFQKTDTLLVAPEGKISPPIKLRAALELMKVIDDDPYETLLKRYLEIVCPRSIMDVRPNRGQMRAGLRSVVEQHLDRVTSGEVAATPGMVHDDVGADELQKEREAEERRRAAAEAEKRRQAAAAASKSHDQVRRHKRR